MSLLLALQGAATTYTLSCSTGSYTETGKAATFQVKTPAAKGAYTEAGIAATFRVSTPASKGTYAVVGKAALFLLRSPEAVGAFTVTGKAITFQVRSPEAGGSYADTGKTETNTISMPVAKGTYLVTGRDAALLRAMLAQAGSFSVSGKTATFTISEPMARGLYAVNGNDAGLFKASRLVCDPGSYSVTGRAITFTIDAALVRGIYGVQGFAALLGNEQPPAPPEQPGTAGGNSRFVSQPRWFEKWPLRYTPARIEIRAFDGHRAEIHLVTDRTAAIQVRDAGANVRVFDVGNVDVMDAYEADVGFSGVGVLIRVKSDGNRASSK